MGASGRAHAVGVIANPVSARDVRRVIANATSLQSADRANIVLRALAALAACGVERVLAMPDRRGITTLVERGLDRERNLGHHLPDVELLDMDVTSTVDDTLLAASLMAKEGVAAIVVLGGDGTHRAVVRACGEVPIAGISTGTNNAYPEMREPTITGLATGLFATGLLGPDEALDTNKALEVSINHGERVDLALVDVVISTDRYIGARALWRVSSLREVYVSFADPEAVGMSAIAGLLEPVGRREPEGLRVVLGEGGTVTAPIAPGMIEPVGVASWHRLAPDEPIVVTSDAGVVALDGERELELRPGDHVTVTLRTDAFRSIAVSRCLHLAAQRGLLRDQPPERRAHG